MAHRDTYRYSAKLSPADCDRRVKPRSDRIRGVETHRKTMPQRAARRGDMRCLATGKRLLMYGRHMQENG